MLSFFRSLGNGWKICSCDNCHKQQLDEVEGQVTGQPRKTTYCGMYQAYVLNTLKTKNNVLYI